MPTLTWATKITPETDPALSQSAKSARLIPEAVIFPQGCGYPEAIPENHLFLGDNLKVMTALLPQYAGQIHLIYADPPFFTNKQYQTRIGRGEDSRRPQDWQLAEGYTDHWPDLDAYLDFLYPRLTLMYRLLAPTGTLYLHLDWHADAYARLLLDEIFGPQRLLNEIIWSYHGPSPIRRAFNRKHDILLAYTKSPDYTFNTDAIRQPYNPNTVKTFKSSSKAGFGKVPDLERGKVPEDWWYFPVVARLHNERTGYPTQKPEALLERIILASSIPGDLVADFFCGSGTTPLVAGRLGRRFLAGDASWRAVHTTRSRLVQMPSDPFTLQRHTAVSIPAAVVQLSASLVQPATCNLKPDTCSRELDYWEIDPAWDGRIFRSAAQAWRPKRSGEMSLSLRLPVEASAICIRAVTPDGDQIQINFN